MLFGVGGGVIAAAVVSPAARGLVIAGVLAWSIASWRRTRKGDAIVFRVEHGQLTVMRRGSAHPLLPPLPLSSVLDVTLDSKSITPVTRDTSISAVAPQMKIRGEVDISRIVLVPAAPREPVAITEEHVAHMDAIRGGRENSVVSPRARLATAGRTRADQAGGVIRGNRSGHRPDRPIRRRRTGGLTCRCSARLRSRCPSSMRRRAQSPCCSSRGHCLARPKRRHCIATSRCTCSSRSYVRRARSRTRPDRCRGSTHTPLSH